MNINFLDVKEGYQNIVEMRNLKGCGGRFFNHIFIYLKSNTLAIMSVVVSNVIFIYLIRKIMYYFNKYFLINVVKNKEKRAILGAVMLLSLMAGTNYFFFSKTVRLPLSAITITGISIITCIAYYKLEVEKFAETKIMRNEKT